MICIFKDYVNTDMYWNVSEKITLLLKEANTSPTIFLPLTGTQALAKEWLDWWE